MAPCDEMKPISVRTCGSDHMTAIGYYRTMQPATMLGIPHRNGFWHKFMPSLSDQMEYLWKNYNLLITERYDQIEWVAAILGSKMIYGGKVIIDVDDDVTTVPEDNAGSCVYREGNPRLDAVKLMLSEADGLTVSTEQLKKVMSQFNTNVEVFENKVGLELWKGIENNKKNDGTIRIGWAGSKYHHSDLAIITPALEQIIAKYPQVRLCVIGYMPHEWAHLPVERGTPAPFEVYYRRLAEQAYDIGIAPLADLDFNKSKSALKYIEYSMLRVPSVCQRGKGLPYEPKIEEGIDGLLAGTTQEWVSAMSALVENETLRKEMGEKANERVSRNTPDADKERRLAFYRDTFSGERVNESIGKNIQFASEFERRLVGQTV